MSDKADKMNTNKISETDFRKICEGVSEDREIICKHNPIGTEEETLLWMILGALIAFLSLDENETPCFNGKPTAQTYREAISFVLENRKAAEFDEEKYLNEF